MSTKTQMDHSTSHKDASALKPESRFTEMQAELTAALDGAIAVMGHFLDNHDRLAKHLEPRCAGCDCQCCVAARSEIRFDRAALAKARNGK